MTSVHHSSGDRGGVESLPYSGHFDSISLNAKLPSISEEQMSSGLLGLPGLKAERIELGVIPDVLRPALIASS